MISTFLFLYNITEKKPGLGNMPAILLSCIHSQTLYQNKTLKRESIPSWRGRFLMLWMFTVLFSLSWAFPLLSFKDSGFHILLLWALSLSEYREFGLEAGTCRRLWEGRECAFLQSGLHLQGPCSLHYCQGQSLCNFQYQSLLLPIAEVANRLEVCVSLWVST